ncbi:MAG: LLM class flavin-dependent oxidoreductase [Bordetella sp.]|nr:LLM class flavin-dependent oxidoreductase [Bordetella sp.]
MTALVLNANIYDFGADAGAWRAPGTHPLDNLGAAFWRHVARLADDGGLDGIFLADMPGLSANPAIRPNRMVEPLATLAVVLAETRTLGVIATLSTSAHEPLELAERLFEYHAMSGGRFGWNVVTGVPQLSLPDFGLDRQPERDTRYARAEAFVQAVLAAGDAAAEGRAFHHEQPYFPFGSAQPAAPRVRWPGRPLIVQAGGSDQGRQLAARSADAVFSAESVLEVARANRLALRRMAAELGRRPPLVLPGIHLVVGSTAEEAERRFDQVHSRGPRDYVLRRLAGLLDVDPYRLDLDAPAAAEIARVAGSVEHGSAGFRRAITGFAAAHALTVRQLLRHYAGFGHQFFVGTPEQLADVMAQWQAGEAADGFNLLFDANPTGLREFVEQVMPVLRRRGLAAAHAPTTPFARRLQEMAR